MTVVRVGPSLRGMIVVRRQLSVIRGLLTDTGSARAVLVDFPCFTLRENKFLMFKPPTTWYFVMAVEAGYHTKDVGSVLSPPR